jgi:chemotaxis signal transduction protein
MNTEQNQKVEKLRKAFDESFAEEFRALEEKKDSFIYFLLGTRGYAISSLHLTGFAKAGHVTPLPARSRGLLGMGSNRGQLLPVYSLAALLSVNEKTEQAQWLAITGGIDSVAFAINELIGFEAADQQHELGGTMQPYVQGYCVRGGARFALVQIDQLYREITQGNKPQI